MSAEADFLEWDDQFEEGYTTLPHVPQFQTPQSLMSEKLIEQVARIIRAGNYHQTAAATIGVRPQVFQKWLMRGTPDTAYWRSLGPWGPGDDLETTPALHGIYCRFRRAVEKASAEAEAFHVTVLTKAARDGDWKASEAWLRRGPAKDRWRDDLHVQTTGEIAHTHRHEVDPQRLRELVRGMDEAGLLDEDVIDGEATEIRELGS